MSTNLIAQVNAIKLLRRKIKFLVDIFENSPEVRSNPSFSRRLNQIVSELQLLDQASKQNESMIEANMYSDVACLNMLASATKGFEFLQEVTKEFSKVNKKGGREIFGIEAVRINAQMDI